MMDPFRVEDPVMGSLISVCAARMEGQTHERTHPTVLALARQLGSGASLWVGLRRGKGSCVDRRMGPHARIDPLRIRVPA